MGPLGVGGGFCNFIVESGLISVSINGIDYFVEKHLKGILSA